LLRFIEQCAAAYAGKGFPALERILEQATLFFIPLVNPDGVDLATGALPPGCEAYESAKALCSPQQPFPTGWKANIRGVDLNVNYPAGWETARSIKKKAGFTEPGPRDYVGPYPLSEPESRAMAAFTRSRDFDITLSFHSQGMITLSLIQFNYSFAQFCVWVQLFYVLHPNLHQNAPKSTACTQEKNSAGKPFLR
jgi:g-D-glutamyl-meso-diaminopimelate peptidase